jgi:hypothetical protein
MMLVVVVGCFRAEITPQVLLLSEIGFLASDDPQFIDTIKYTCTSCALHAPLPLAAPHR